MSVAFSSPTGERFDAVQWSTRHTGCPIIEGTVAWLDCRMHDVLDAGDHYILIGRVEAYDHGSQSPLGYYRGAYVTFGLAEEALRAHRRNVEGRSERGSESDGAPKGIVVVAWAVYRAGERDLEWAVVQERCGSEHPSIESEPEEKRL